MPIWIWQQPGWPVFRYDEKALLGLLGQARLKQGKLMGLSALLDGGLSLQARAQILIEESLNTSAIEGECFDLDALRSSVARHLGLPTTGLPVAPRAVDGLIEVLLDATSGFAQPLTLQRLFGWQAALFPTGYSGLFEVRTGALRGDEPMRVVSGPVGREKVHFEAPPQTGLDAQLAEFLTWFENPPAGLDGLLRAGLAHLRFVTLHPFEDGNGRLARAITDMALCRDEGQAVRMFSMSAQIMRNREAYYAVLESTQRGGLDVTQWLAWFLGAVSAACDQSETTVGRVIAKAKFWLHHQNTELNERQRKALNRLLDVGADGFEGGMNTRKYASLNKTSRATAYRELADLVGKKCLVQVGEGRSTRYGVTVLT
ncbi:MAG: Fic family protein [Sulfuricellaceae bacterium]